MCRRWLVSGLPLMSDPVRTLRRWTHGLAAGEDLGLAEEADFGDVCVDPATAMVLAVKPADVHVAPCFPIPQRSCVNALRVGLARELQIELIALHSSGEKPVRGIYLPREVFFGRLGFAGVVFSVWTGDFGRFFPATSGSFRLFCSEAHPSELASRVPSVSFLPSSQRERAGHSEARGPVADGAAGESAAAGRGKKVAVRLALS